MRPILASLLLVTTTTTTLRGLAAASDPLKPYGGGTVSLIDDVFSDPDHLVSPYDGHHIIQLLKTCGDQARHKVVVYLAANFTSNDNVKPTTTTSSTVTTTATNPDSGGGARGRGQRWSRSTVDEVDGSTVIIHLKELVVAANNLTNTNPSVILLVVIRKPFQMATWRSDSQRFTLLKALHNNTAPLDQQRFTAAVVHVAQDLCQSERVSRSKPQSRIIFTILWIAFTIMFVALLVAIAVVLIRGYREAVGWARTEEGQQMVRPARSQLIARGSDIQDFSAVSFLSTGHVLLGTMDIAAVTDIAVVPQQGCTSTDNLLQV